MTAPAFVWTHDDPRNTRREISSVDGIQFDVPDHLFHRINGFEGQSTRFRVVRSFEMLSELRLVERVRKYWARPLGRVKLEDEADEF
ncbi:hypothetical protein C469_10921 [Halorubrum lipolyticum DSM 21995]|uniref:Uncharacterized protein n=1 Tax=Halorubrum lipolyticum DSM 21995 TaxID=1227482 RepID=M0NMH2_9EURY|nr:hypothetical protein C469_10921 [Halorubrum lipolyticum DSM 21995]